MRVSKVVVITVLALIVLLSFTGCGSSSSNDDKTPKITDLEKVKKAADNLSVVWDGKATTADSITLPSKQDDAVITWSSSNQNIVSNNGKVTRSKEGDMKAELTATLTVGKDTVNKKFNITVLIDDAVEIYTNFSEVEVGKTISIHSNKSEVSWSVDRGDLASIDNGILKGLKSGEVTVSAKLGVQDRKVKVYIKAPIIMSGTFIDWGGKANPTIDNKMNYDGNGIWTKIVDVTAVEKDYVVDMVKFNAPAGANAGFVFRVVDNAGNTTGQDFGVANNSGTIVGTNGSNLGLVEIQAEKGNIWTKLVTGKKYKFTFNAKDLSVKIEGI